MFHHTTDIRVRYGETDQMGYLYYGNYALYYEVSRAEAIRSLGITYRDMETNTGVMMPVMSMSCRYLRPARYDELLTVHSTLRHLPNTNMLFHHEIYNANGKLINGGEVKLAFIEITTSKRITAPQFLLETLKPYF